MRQTLRTIPLVGVLFAPFVIPSTALAKKTPLTQADWDRWRSIQGAALSNDGVWVAYTLSPQVGDGEFVLRATAGTTEYRVPVGYIGCPNNTPGGAPPWYQGIELFVGMRRLGKEVYMIDYNNDVHNPASRANQKDIAMRMQQFFDNKLKGSPAPDWMVKGIAAKDKGKDQVNTAPNPITP